MDDFLSHIEVRLQSAFGSNTLLSQTGGHLCLASGAKRVRPLLTAYFGSALNIPAQDIIPFAISSELIHSASLLHDDVVDAGEMRRGRPTVNAQWSNSVAVLSGNHLLSLALRELKPYSPAITQEAISVVDEMTRAAILELQMRNSKVHTIDDWRLMATGKTGSLFAFCGTSVALYAGDNFAAQAFKQAGHHIGTVFQLVDDLSDLQEDLKNLEGSYPRLLSLNGHTEPVDACKAELRVQAALAFESLGKWRDTEGGQQIKIWLDQLSCFAS
ncbi:MAG: polyprenyl synthetase family protein [Myxococcota bacterium]